MIKILAIDDNNDDLIALGAIIQDSFPEVIYHTALSGKKGIELAISTDPDVIFIDIVMPDMDGFEVCRQLKRDDRTGDIPVVFHTAMKEDREKRIKALEVGGEAFLYKPIDEPELVAQIRAMLKVREFNNRKRYENERLLQLVAERTQELEQSHAETLKLLNELKAENEKYQNTEEELRESEEKYRLLHESAGVGIGYYTPEGTVISFNAIAALHMNGKREDFIGKSIYTLFPNEDADHYMDRIKKAANSENSLEFEDKVDLPTDVKWFQSVFTRILNSSNQVIGVQIISTEITEQKRAEEALKESESKFRLLFTQMSEGFALHKVIYDENHTAVDYRILDINPAFEKQVGIQAEKAKGVLATQLYGVSPAPYIDIYAQVAETGEHYFFQTYFPPLDRYFQISVFSPNPGYFATIFVDITERRKAEEAIKENESRLRELNATKDKFFSIIAHDLKSPFNSILGLSNMLADQVREKNHEGIEEYAGIIQKSTQRVFDLLMNLLEWSRSQTGRMEFSREYIELGALINEVIELLGESAHLKSITIIRELPRNMLVFADKAMISTILRNLISNAIKFTYPGGKIVISSDKKPDELMISISDNGIGIKKEVIDKLFRIDETYIAPGTQEEKGTGLGLILCKEFIEKHGGKIWVESEVDKGSTFYFTIPKN